MYLYIYMYILKRDLYCKCFITAKKTTGGKVNAHQLQNGGIKYGIFMPQIMKPFKRITELF